MTRLRAIWIILFLALFGIGAAFIDFYLPRVEIVKVTGTDVKRVDRKFNEGAMDRVKGIGENDRIDVGKTRDVRFVYAETLNGGIRVYRNEDTGWAFPFYFKFDSGTVASRASALSNRGQDEAQRYAIARTYGWRIEILSMFPNLITLKEATPDSFAFPILKTGFLSLWIVMLVWFYRWTGRFRTVVDQGMEDLGEMASDLADEASAAMDKATETFSDRPEQDSKPESKATVDPDSFFKKK